MNWAKHESLVSFCKFTWLLIRYPGHGFEAASPILRGKAYIGLSLTQSTESVLLLFVFSCVTLKLFSAASYGRHCYIEKQGFYYSI
jgi:hypothetical protein